MREERFEGSERDEMDAEEGVSGGTSGGTGECVAETVFGRVSEVESLVCDLVLTMQWCKKQVSRGSCAGQPPRLITYRRMSQFVVVRNSIVKVPIEECLYMYRVR